MKTYIFPINFGIPQSKKNPDKVYHALHWGEVQILFKQVIVVFSALPVV